LKYVIAEYKIADGTCSFDLKPSTLKEIMAFPAGTMILIRLSIFDKDKIREGHINCLIVDRKENNREI
jgi:hypothetical protein